MPLSLGLKLPALNFYEITQDAVIFMDLSGIIKYTNPAVTKLTQYESSVFLNKTCDKFKAEGTIDILEITQKLAFQQSLIQPFNCKRKDGKLINLTASFSFLRAGNGKAIGIFLILKDHEIKSQDEIEFFKQQHHLLSALNFRSDEICMIFDRRNWGIIYCSDSIENILGWTAEDYTTGGSAFTLATTHPDDGPTLNTFILDEMKKREKADAGLDLVPFIFESRKRHKNGSYVWIRSETSILSRDSNNEILFAIVFFRKVERDSSDLNKVDYSKIRELLDNGLENLNFNGSSKLNSSIHSLPLSAREKEILNLVKDGLSTKQIAAKLSLTNNTVNTYRKNLMNKLNAKNSAELVRIVMENQTQ